MVEELGTQGPCPHSQEKWPSHPVLLLLVSVCTEREGHSWEGGTLMVAGPGLLESPIMNMLRVGSLWPGHSSLGCRHSNWTGGERTKIDPWGQARG